MKKSLILSMGVIVIFFGLLVSPTAHGVELTVWSPSWEAQKNWMEKAGELYEEKTGVSVNVKPVKTIRQDELLAVKAPKEGEGPDIVGFPHDNLSTAVEADLLVPVEEYLPEGYVRENYSEVSVDALTYKNELYGIPFSYETTVLIYNKDLVDEIPETFEQLKKLATELTDRNNNEYGFYFPLDDFYYAYGFMGGFGGYIFGEENGHYDVSDLGIANEGAIAGVEYISSFFAEGVVDPLENSSELFKKGDLAMLLEGPWAFGSYIDAGIDIGVAPLPKLPNGEYPETFVGVSGHYISNYSPRKEEAAEFIKWVNDFEMAKKQLKDLNQLVPHKEVLNSSLLEEDLLEAVVTQADRGRPIPNIPEMELVWDPAANGFRFVIFEGNPAEDVMPLIKEEIKQNIEHISE